MFSNPAKSLCKSISCGQPLIVYQKFENMKKFTQFATATLMLLLTTAFSTSTFAQFVTASVKGIILPSGANTVNVTITRGGTWTGSGNYTWSVSSVTGLSTSPVITTTGTSLASSTSSITATFNSSATVGSYIFTISRGTTTENVRVNVSLAPTTDNLWASYSSGGRFIGGFKVANGAYVSGPTQIFDNRVTVGGQSTPTVAIGKWGSTPADADQYFYWIPASHNYAGNNGTVLVYGRKADGTGTSTLIGSVDINGASTSELGFVRLGMRKDGRGYIVAGDGSKIHLATFQANGLNAATITILDNDVTISGGSAGTFQNGDLCFSGTGKMYVLANSGSTTQIFTAAPPFDASTVLTKDWDLVQPDGTAFTESVHGTVNGVAFDAAGSLYISTGIGIYYIDQFTVNNFNAGTVITTLVNSQSGITDLASNFFPEQSTLPISFGELTVKKASKGATVTWTTLSESNNDYFVVERSTDGINYVAAGTVKGAGNSNVKQIYNFNDATLSATQVVYYRIRQVDLDRKQNLSSTVSLRLDGIRIKNYTAYPNPFTSILKLQLESAAPETVNVRLSNAAGQVVKTLVVSLQKGNNAVILSGLESVKAGFYLLEMISSEGVQTQKIYKQ
jgi:hypothetical protein